METCTRGSLLASFPRDFPRENEEGLRVRDWSETSAFGWKASIPRVESRIGDRGRSRENSVGSFLTRSRCAEGARSPGKREDRGKGEERLARTV